MSSHASTQLPGPLSIDDFSSFYESIHGFTPFHWQMRLAEEVCLGDWPDYIKLPTSSGKTSVIDIAVFALAFQACESNRAEGKITAPRRIFFVVDRRIIVNEAYLQTRAMAQKLWDSIAGSDNANTENSGILRRVALWLQHLTADPQAPPLDCHELRGGIYRDDAWVRSPLQPTVLASTVDQIGSRLLFRGYGVSDRNLPIHAALTANHSLIILDEAHCSRPFSQTLDSIARYRSDRWAERPIDSPFSFVQMTATPPADLAGRMLFELHRESDYEKDPLLKKRHHCSKPVALVGAKRAKGKTLPDKLGKKLVEQALQLAGDHDCKRIAIVVNRVAIARATFELLQEKLRKLKRPREDASLMIGRMRPLDRDTLTKSLQTKFRSGAEESFETPKFVVATQCLEVGADFDFDGMICQCASLDALRQRFGRLNRLGDAPHARGVILAAEGDLQEESKLKEDKPHDPIYGNALARTWHWLNENATALADIPTDDDPTEGDNASEPGAYEIDFGIVAMEETTAAQSDEEKQRLSAPAPDAPVLMPAHVDMLCQTSPRPHVEPNVASYLHGPERGLPEVRVSWRADLDLKKFDPQKRLSGLDEGGWIDTVSVCPPSSAECLSVPLYVLQNWLAGEPIVDQTSDVLGEAADDLSSDKPSKESVVGRCLLVWRGPNRNTNKNDIDQSPSVLVDRRDANRIRPNDTLVIPVEFGGWSELGYLPGAPAEPDIKELVSTAFHSSGTESNGPSDAGDENSSMILASVDVADQAFCETRARTILRLHPKLKPNAGVLQSFYAARLKLIKQVDASLNVTNWKQEISAQVDTSPNDLWDSLRMQRLKELSGKLLRYPGGIVWITGLHQDRHTGLPPLPLDSFGDDDDVLSQTGPVKLLQHLADVHDEVDRLALGIGLPSELADVERTAAKVHDIGKADPRFQAMLLRKPLSVAFMQPCLWAKSDFSGGNPSSELPRGFRHEMLSVDLLDRLATDDVEDGELLAHLVASHHGHARPLAPIAQDDTLPGFRLDELNLKPVTHEERQAWTPSWRLDSGIARRFWELTRRYGWWGLPWLETTLRLADWCASAKPGNGDPALLELKSTVTKPAIEKSESLLLSGIDGSKPLGFLAALGTFRIIGNLLGGSQFLFAWEQTDGAWRPVIFGPDSLELSQEWLLDTLLENLESDVEIYPALRIGAMEVEYDRRKLFELFASEADRENFVDADWLSCNGSDILDSGAISQLQTSRKDYHPKSIRRLLDETTIEHLQRSLFEPWNYSDPIAGISLHIEPREDRRHAYQWNTPSGDPMANISGGMIGANRLALEAWPLFQSLPAKADLEKLETIGFRGLKPNNTKLTWPIWAAPVPLAAIPTVLALRALQKSKVAEHALDPLGIPRVFRCNRILVGKTPNLTTASPAKA